jgi:hypothetical protein
MKANQAAAVLAAALIGALAVPHGAGAQGLTYSSGQGVAPAFEGWRDNPDGTFSLVFGYMNRNWEEQPDLPIGEDNFFSPGERDRGQPTTFLPRRNRFVFEVRVPADFGERELAWTLRRNGEAETAFGSLRPDYYIDNVVIMSEAGTLGAGTSSPELRAHTPPVVEMRTPTEIQAVVGRPVRLEAWLGDDGLPRRSRNRLPVTEEGRLDLERALTAPPSRITVQKIIGLNMSWSVYRGPEGVDTQDVTTFDPPQVAAWEDTRPFSNSPWAPFWVPPALPEDGVWITEVTFTQPGRYVLRGRADDGGLFTDQLVVVNVGPPIS